MKIWVLNPPFLPKYSRPQRSPAVTKSGTLYYPLWLAYATGVLEAAGHEVTLSDAPARGIDGAALPALAQRLQPDLVIMDTSTPSIENDGAVAAAIKRALPRAFVTLVGTHVSALPEETLRAYPAVDALARREYEYTCRELAAVLAAHGPMPPAAALQAVAGLSFRGPDGLHHNPDRPFIENLDELPWVSRVYRRHLRIGDYFNPNARYPMITLVTSRGCPFHCSFCVYPQIFTGHRFRFRSIPDVVAEMAWAARECPEIRSFFFEDDTLTANQERCLEFADAVRQAGIKVPWTANARVGLDLETMRRLRAAGCREFCVGFESSDQATLNAMHKGITPEAMFRFMADARRAGILIHGCFMVGFPGETRAAIERTIQLAIRLRPDTVQFYPVMVYPGTAAFADYQARGWLTANNYRNWLTPAGLHNCVIRNEELTGPELVALCDLGRRRFYLRPGYVAYKLRQLLAHPGEARRTLKAARVFGRHLLRGSRLLPS